MSLPESAFRTIVESSPDAYWVFDLEGRTIYANAQLAQMYGVDPDEVTAIAVFDTLDAAGREMFRDHLADLRAGRLNHDDVECLFVRKDQSTTWVLLRESAWLDESGNLIGAVHRISEYAARRAHHDDLTESRRRLAETQRIARVGGWDWEVVTNRLVGTEALAGLYGMSVEAFPHDIDSLLALAHPDDLRAIGESMRPIGRGEDHVSFLARFRARPEAEWMWIRAHGVVTRDAAGRAVSVSGTHQDVTELMLAEGALEDQVSQNALLRAIATSANRAQTLDDLLPHLRELVLSHDDWERARFFRVNEGRILPHLTSPAEQEADLTDPVMAAADLDLAASAAAEGGPVWSTNNLAVATPVVVADETVGVLLIASTHPLVRHVMIQDSLESTAVQVAQVIERDLAQQKLSDARDAALKASRHKSEFLATMSHEIRTPLNGVIGLNELLLRSDLDEAQRRLGSGVQIAGRALLAVLNDVLDFSKIEAGKIDLESLDFDVRTVFEQVGDVVGESARSKGLELILSCHRDVPERVNGDPTRLAQVLTNLTSNAVKFTPDGEVLVHAGVQDADESGTMLHVEVSDTGIGLDPKTVPSLLEPFAQADSSITRVYGGTGLGLAISKQIVQALGGELTYRPNQAGGSTFSFTARLALAGPQATHDREEEARSVLGGSRALIVDDNEHNRLILLEQVAAWDMEATAVGSAAEALDLLLRAKHDAAPYDIVLLDYAMPQRDGIALAQDVSREVDDPPTMLMLTSITPVDETAIRQAGILECLTKPVPVDTLRSMLLRWRSSAPRPPAPRTTDAATKHRWILVVEDNEVNQMVALGVLQALGYDAEVVDNGAQAVDRIERGGVDAVLMDVQMPILDGYAATRAIRMAGHRHLPIIAMTAAAVEGERERCLEAGMDAYLTKPIDPTTLANTLEEWLGSAPGTRDDDEEPTNDPTPPIDGLDTERLDMLRDLDPGDTTYLDRAIGNFVANTGAAVDSLDEAIAGADAEQIRAISHKLSGSASNLGVVDAAENARALELIALEGHAEELERRLNHLRLSVIEGCRLLLFYQSTYSEVVKTSEGNNS